MSLVLTCDFCGKPRAEVKALVRSLKPGVVVAICDKCAVDAILALVGAGVVGVRGEDKNC